MSAAHLADSLRMRALSDFQPMSGAGSGGRAIAVATQAPGGAALLESIRLSYKNPVLRV
jgi:hypothetical protein